MPAWSILFPSQPRRPCVFIIHCRKRLAMTTKYRTSRQVSCSSEDIKLGKYSATAQLSHAFAGVFCLFVAVCLFFCYSWTCFIRYLQECEKNWETVSSDFKKVSPAVRASTCNCTGLLLEARYCPSVTLQHFCGDRDLAHFSGPFGISSLGPCNSNRCSFVKANLFARLLFSTSEPFQPCCISTTQIKNPVSSILEKC